MDNKPGYIQGEHPKGDQQTSEDELVQRIHDTVWSLPVMNVSKVESVEYFPTIGNTYDRAVAAGKDAKLKASIPKEQFGDNKIPFHMWPETATALGALALLDGGLKYGRSNYRAIGVKASTYYNAAHRHLDFWFEGEDLDPDSNLPHLAHVLACVAILVESIVEDNMTDDRMFKTNFRKWMEELTPHVARLKKLHEGKSPQHYTIQESKK